MKKLSLLLMVAVAVVALTASPAVASTLRVSASARQCDAHRVAFSAKLSRPGRVRIAVYRRGRAVRKLTAYRSGSTYKANWTGSSVAAGTYSYRVSATWRSGTKVARGSIVVAAPASVRAVGASGRTGPARWIGLYVPGSPSAIAPLAAAETLAGGRAAVVNFFVSDSESFPTARCQNVAAHGSVPMITLEFSSIGAAGLSAIDNGSRDAYITTFADAAKAYGAEVRIRPFHEMNGDWYPWGGTVGGNSSGQLVAAWKHVHDIFAAEGASNVKFVWCVNSDSVPSTPGNAISAYWPGDAYVDYATLDGYNFGTARSSSSWRSFSAVFGPSYATVAGLTSKPLFIAETSSVEQGGSKAAWVADMFASIPSKFPRLTGVCWFDALKGEDWRFESSTSSAGAFKIAIASGF